jgi:hypothetical protein
VLEGYYSKWRKRSHGPDRTREEVRAKRLDRENNDDPVHLQRGYGADADIYAVRMGYDLQFDKAKQHKLYTEPYAVYVHAPELKVEFEADSSARYLTVGNMVEYQHGNWSVNFECAGQIGSQKVHPIDRNHLVVDDAYYSQTATEFGDGGTLIFDRPKLSASAGRLDKRIGQPMKYQSHIFLGATTPGETTDEYLPYQAYYVSDEVSHINDARNVSEQGAQIRTSKPTGTDTHTAGVVYESKKHTPDSDSIVSGNGSLYSQYQFKTGIDYYDTVFGLLGRTPNGTLYNANLPFGGQQRFREGYKVTYKSVMAMLDVRYSLPKKRMNFSFAAGYVGGDDYPFQNHTKNQTSHAFMPWRDANYVGRWVTSFVALYPRKLPRPMEMSDNELFAHNNYKTMQNLQYLGCGTQWYPYKDRSLMLELNALYLWEAMPPHKWDTGKRRTFANNSKPDKEDSMYRYIQDNELHFSGSATSERASKRLGAELNFVVSWRPYSSLQFDLRGGVFLPGQLYRDIEGCPNINTRRVDAKGDWHHDSLGHAAVSGAQGRVTYKF